MGLDGLCGDVEPAKSVSEFFGADRLRDIPSAAGSDHRNHVLELGTDPAEEESVIVDQEHGSHPSPPGIVRCTSVPTPSDESITAVPPLRVTRPVEYVGAAMAVIAVGLIVGVLIGRARWLILIGVLLVPALLAAALLPGTVEWPAGSPNYRPATVEQVQESYELGLGRVVLDLTRLSAQKLAEVGTIEVSI